MRVLSISLVITACASTPPADKATGPRGLRASDHLAAARDHDEQARQRRSWPVTTAMVPGSPDTPIVVPWYRTWDTSAEHERRARAHRSQAGALQAAFEDACGDRPLEQIAVSPLLRLRTGGWNTTTGVIVYLSPLAGTADELLSALRCHRAWMMLAPQPAMDDCPLDLPGLHLDARGDADGITLVLTVREPQLIPELQRRVAAQAEAQAREVHEH
jgi:hypothetical protein